MGQEAPVDGKHQGDLHLSSWRGRRIGATVSREGGELGSLLSPVIRSHKKGGMKDSEIGQVKGVILELKE